MSLANVVKVFSAKNLLFASGFIKKTTFNAYDISIKNPQITVGLLNLLSPLCF